MDVASYFDRIGYGGSGEPTVEVLRRIHRQHMLTVPFENLDIQLGRPIVLDQKRFYQKIVENGRGGYCYELNGSFSWLLRRLGFRVSRLSARVAGKNGRFSPEFDHMTLLVRLKDRWLVDVGFGDSFTTPKRFDSYSVQLDNGYAYRIVRKGMDYAVSRRADAGHAWQTQYAFRLRPRIMTEFAARNRYQQTSPNSHFTQGRLITQLTRSGRITLTDKKLIETRDGNRLERKVRTKRDFDSLLVKHFGVQLDSRL